MSKHQNKQLMERIRISLDLRALAERGLSQKEACAELGLRQSRASEIMKEFGIVMRHGNVRKPQ